jgi:thiol-disulfide isomerase/thioredoxin
MQERIHAPDFAFVQSWLNTDRPISMRELRGQVVVLDFWTYCCVNCMHVLPILRDLEERHAGDPLVVIGVHSAKFDAEKDAAHIQAAMGRYGVAHPVAVDEDMEVWSRYAVRSWPTLVVVRPDGTLAAVAPGEPDPTILEAFIASELAEGRKNGTLAKEPVRFAAHRAEAPAQGTGGLAQAENALSYPGKAIAAHDGTGRLFVADSAHHRVLILDAAGGCLDAIGSGLRGHLAGSFEKAALDDPQGLAHDPTAGEALYIADARAHAVWKADLKSRTLSRLAGTFELGRAPLAGTTPKLALATALRSPWDLALSGRTLYLALAGSHQIAAVDLRTETLSVLAGTGREALIDGPTEDSAWAQPSGLSLSGNTLYVADSESSAVRALDVAAGTVATLAGGPGLFDFGDQTGPAQPAMLQHPLAVLATPQGVLVADTYNDKLKRFSPDGARLEPFFTASEGISLAQPAGLAPMPGGDVLVADTNHHRLVRVSADGKGARLVEVKGAPAWKGGAAQKPAPQGPASAAGWFSAIVQAPAGVGLGRGVGRIVLSLRAPQGFALSAGAPWSAQLEVSRRSDLLGLSRESLSGTLAGGSELSLVIETTAAHEGDVDSELLVSLRSVACDAVDHAACFPVQNQFHVPLRLLREGQPEVRFALPIEVRK